MTQPTGRVLSIPNNYRTYLRSFPIICALDAISFVIRILVTPLLINVTIREAFNITIRERYADTEDQGNGIQSLEKQTFLRWIFFLVGTLGPAIKLSSMQGVPWTKAWGMMFLGAFLIFESMALFGRSPHGTGREGAPSSKAELSLKYI